MSEEPEVDEFDSLLEDDPNQIVVPAPAPSRMSNSLIKDRIVNTEVARALVEGASINDLAIELGVKPATIRKWMNRFEMKDLLKIESRRIVRHLSRRNLSREKYLGLATALGTLIDKTEVLEHGVPQSPFGAAGATIIANIKIGLFGRASEGGSTGSGQNLTVIDASAVREVPAEPEEE